MFEKSNCPICNNETNLLNKSVIKYNDNYVCQNCIKILANQGIIPFNIKKYNLDELKEKIYTPIIDNSKNIFEFLKYKNHNFKSLIDNKTDNKKVDYDNINYDEVFSELNPDIMVYFKIHKKLNAYVKTKTELKKKGFKENDILWNIFLQIKNEAELKKEFNGIGSALNKMSELLCSENKYSQALPLFLAETYCICQNITDYSTRFGTMRTKSFETILMKNDRNIRYKEYKDMVAKNIGTLYNDKIGAKIYRYLDNEFKLSNLNNK